MNTDKKGDSVRKVFLSILLVPILTLIVACTAEEDVGTQEADGRTAPKNTGDNEEELANPSEVSNEPNNVEPNQDNKKTSEFGKLTIESEQQDVNDTYETGPIHLTIQSLQVASLEPEEEYKQQFNGRESLTMVTVQMEVENTSEDPIRIDPSQGVLVTNTNKPLDAKPALSDDVGGDFNGQTTKEGEVYFILDTKLGLSADIGQDVSGQVTEKGEVYFAIDSLADNMKSGTLIIDAPHSGENYSDVGEELYIDINFQ
ncbi:DUF4352 domain-containing protein [Gracilibacillus phocaeensis]|uniref:DUF4352 domain-containing protein n=1 Tax=Gracilibacillus phocaeensis TaxID=2042304 RepID=UPI0010302ADA|nr:DUF4352 domain-containing protein [Gracilibacillus phocaeensis]